MALKTKSDSIKNNYGNLKVRARNLNRTKVYQPGSNESVAVFIRNSICDSTYETPSNIVFVNSFSKKENKVHGPIQKVDIKKRASIYQATITYTPFNLNLRPQTMSIVTKSPTLKKQLMDLEEKLNLIEIMRLNTHSCEWHRENQE